MTALTPKQDAVIVAIRDLTVALGFPPTLRQIAAAVHLSPSRVRQHVDRLVTLGLLVRTEATARSIRLVEFA
jgi:SOS-response transcriptional repressor LexA